MITLLAPSELLAAIDNSSEARARGCFGFQTADLSLIPAFPLSVTELLDDVVGVEIIDTNLPTHPWARVPEIWIHTHLFSALIGDRGNRGAIYGRNRELLGGLPHPVKVSGFIDVTSTWLEEDGKRPLLVGDDADTGASDRFNDDDGSFDHGRYK
jgi:hypothetical protein